MKTPRTEVQRRAAFCTARTLDAAATLAAINAHTLEPLTADDVYVHTMRLSTNVLCESDYFAFSDTALTQIAEKVVGRSVLAGHDYSTLPLGRFYAGRTTGFDPAALRPGVGAHADVGFVDNAAPRAVEASFYLLRGGVGDDIHRQIRGGVYRDVSIGWRFTDAECSICGKSLWKCEHWPGESYEGGDSTPRDADAPTRVVCFGIIRNITEVLEGSLVFEGADAFAEVVRAAGQPTHRAPAASTVLALRLQALTLGLRLRL